MKTYQASLICKSNQTGNKYNFYGIVYKSRKKAIKNAIKDIENTEKNGFTVTGIKIEMQSIEIIPIENIKKETKK